MSLSMTDSKGWSSFPRRPIVWTQLIIKILFPLYAAGHQTFDASKVCKNALSIRQCGFSRSHAHQKNIGTLFCSFLLNESLIDIFTKPLRFRFGSASCPIVQLFF
jgi:hypothetical protein